MPLYELCSHVLIAVSGVLYLVMGWMLLSSLCISCHPHMTQVTVSVMTATEHHVIIHVLWQGRTPLHIAAMATDAYFATLMMDNGADPTVLDHEVTIFYARKTSQVSGNDLTFDDHTTSILGAHLHGSLDRLKHIMSVTPLCTMTFLP